jgi:hypothetical protein
LVKKWRAHAMLSDNVHRVREEMMRLSLKRQPEEEIERHIKALIAHLKTLDVAGRQAIIARILHETVK